MTQQQPKKKRKVCGRKTEVYSRVVGYYGNSLEWNPGKQQEFKDRKVFKRYDGKEIK